MLIINKERIEKSISRIKKLHSQAFKEQNIELIGYIEKLNKEVVLALAKFKCQKCSSEQLLQIHHLITRPMRKYINDKWRYLSQRYYWACQACLCRSCHNEFHKEFGLDNSERGLCISEDKIKRIKNKFQKS
jgi:hypothetical protein